MQPVTMTLPFSASAWPTAPSDSALALSRNPQVFTITTSAPSCWRASSYPSARRRVMMRSESTSAFGHPSDTKLILGARVGALVAFGCITKQTRSELVRRFLVNKGFADRVQYGGAALRHRGFHGFALTE